MRLWQPTILLFAACSFNPNTANQVGSPDPNPDPDASWAELDGAIDLADANSPNLDAASSTDASPPTQVTVSFQQGVNGYEGTVDTFFSKASTNSSYGSNTTMLWDINPPSTEADSLLRFENIFGANAGQVPLGSTITTAVLTVKLEVGGTVAPGRMHNVLVNWSENVTYNTFGGDPGYDQSDVSASFTPAPFSAQPCPCAATTMDVTASVASWSGDTKNFGWMFVPVNFNLVSIASSEAGIISSRPKLEITYQ